LFLSPFSPGGGATACVYKLAPNTAYAVTAKPYRRVQFQADYQGNAETIFNDEIDEIVVMN